MTFNEAAVDDVFNQVASAAMQLGVFERVNTHEPKNTPGSGLTCSIWIDTIKPVRTSGLNQTSGLVSFFIRIYNSMLAEPQDDIDPAITKAVSTLISTYTGDFDFGQVADVRMIDLLGAYSSGLSAQAGYMEIGNKMFRVMVLDLPVVINDMFVQVSGS
jgi:hypothetical protein